MSFYDDYDYYDDYDESAPSKADPNIDILKLGTVGGIGSLKYRLTRFEEYDWDHLSNDRLYVYPLYNRDKATSISQKDMPTGKELLVSLYNLAKKINDFSEKKPYLDLIIEWCKQYAHPYFFDEIYETMQIEDISSLDMEKMMASTAQFDLSEFMRDLERLYQATALNFAFDCMCVGDDDMAYDLSEDGKYFAGLPFFEKYRCELPEYDEEDIDINGDLLSEMQTDAKERKENEAYGNFVRVPFDDYERLQETLVDLIPDFNIRLKIDPKTRKAVFVADVKSVFDIAWCTLAKKISEDLVPEEREESREEHEGILMTCQFCGKAYIRSKGSRQITCGSAECQKARKAMNKRNSRKMNAIKKAADSKRDVISD